MSSARKVIDWHGQDAAELAHELAALPRGRYVLVPESELAQHEISPEDEAAVEEGLDDVDRGDTVPWEEVRAELEAAVTAARAGRAP